MYSLKGKESLHLIISLQEKADHSSINWLKAQPTHVYFLASLPVSQDLENWFS